MAHIVDNRVQETTISTGAAALVLAGASSKHVSFADAGFTNGDTFWGLIEHQTAAEFELAFCTYNSGGNITRATPRKSSTGSAVSFSAGTKTISVMAIANNSNQSWREVTSGASYAMVANDCEISVNKSVGSATAITVKAGARGDEAIVADDKGDAATNNITITVASAGTINGQSSQVIDANYQRMHLRHNGTEWKILSVA